MKYSIGITTFSSRYDFVESLLKQIREFVDFPITLVINGEKNGIFDPIYRCRILELCVKHSDVFPVMFREMRGLSKLWNTAMIHSMENDILLLNDDISIENNDVFRLVENVINDPMFSGICRLNGSFSHFIVRKSVMHNIGYFDERLLGFGEEDGDITHRMIASGRNIQNIEIGGLINHVSDIRHEHVAKGIGKYSKFNRDFVYGAKYEPNHEVGSIQGMFDSPMKRLLDDPQQYPHEIFFRDYKTDL